MLWQIRKSRETAPPSSGGAVFIIVLCAIAALFGLSGCSERNANNAHTPNATEWPSPDPAIYEIIDSDGSVEGWIMGTIHALPDDVEWRTPSIDRAIGQADYLVLEVDNFDDSASTFARLATTPGLGDLAPRLEGDLRADLKAMVQRSHYTAASFRDMEEWAAAIILSQVDAPGRAANGVDRAILAEFANREVRGFETATAQFAAFDTLAAEDQRVLLEQTVQDWAQGPQQRRELMRAWIAGDIVSLEKASRSGIMADPELRKALLQNRNEEWAAQLASLLHGEDRPLVAVGAAHVVGPDGLPEMLAARGYDLRLLP